MGTSVLGRGAGAALHRLGAVVMLVGFAGFLSGFVFALDDAAPLARFELPLGRLEGIAVDRAGRIYVGSRDARRVARYGADGRFDRGWHAAVGRGPWRLAIGAGDTPHLDVAGRTLALAGDEFREVGESRRFAALPWAAGETSSPDGARYVLRQFPARVRRHAPGTDERTIVRQSPLAILFTSPLPAWPLAAAGLLLRFFADTRTAAADGSRRLPGAG